MKFLLLVVFGSLSALASKPDANPMLILQLETRDHWIGVAKSADGEPLYQIKDDAGKIIGDFLTEPQFKAKMPELFKTVRKALAGDPNTDGPILDGSVDKKYTDGGKKRPSGP